MPINLRSEGGIIRGQLQVVSITGGRAEMPKRMSTGSIAELQIGTDDGSIRGIVEVLPAQPTIRGFSQPFRFIALDEEDYQKLRGVLNSGTA
jgi:hypothetical protein